MNIVRRCGCTEDLLSNYLWGTGHALYRAMILVVIKSILYIKQTYVIVMFSYRKQTICPHQAQSDPNYRP